MGNPSDGFFGKTVATTIDNFWADAWVWPSATFTLCPHELYDPLVCAYVRSAALP
jgi:glucuronokinase